MHTEFNLPALKKYIKDGEKLKKKNQTPNNNKNRCLLCKILN